MRNGIWFAIFLKDGRHTQKSLGTSDKPEAERLRDEFFRSAGAEAKPKAVDARKDRYVSRRLPYVVRLPKSKGGFYGEFRTQGEAMDARDEALRKFHSNK